MKIVTLAERRGVNASMLADGSILLCGHAADVAAVLSVVRQLGSYDIVLTGIGAIVSVNTKEKNVKNS